MKSQETDGLLSGWDNPRRSRPHTFIASLRDLITKTLVITELEVRKICHDPTELILRAGQPVLWLLIFGQVFARLRSVPTGGTPYLDFMAAGILAQSVLFIAVFSGGMSIIWERDVGTVHKLLASPTPRAALVLGKALACGVRSLSQVVIIYGLSMVLGVKLNLHPLALLGVAGISVLGAVCFAVFSIVIACLVKTRERFTGMGQLLVMPLFFASNAIYPIALMPAWLKVVAYGNPLSYQVDALRSLMLQNGVSTFGLGLDCTILLLITALLTIVCARLYPRIAM